MFTVTINTFKLDLNLTHFKFVAKPIIRSVSHKLDVLN